MATIADLLTLIGEIKDRLGSIEGRLSGMEREQEGAASSRRVVYERIEGVNSEVARLSFTAEAQAGIQAQTREVLKELADVQGRIAENVKPLLDLQPDIASMVEIYQDVRKGRRRLAWIGGVLGASMITVAGFAGEQIRQALAAWLTLP